MDILDWNDLLTHTSHTNHTSGSNREWGERQGQGQGQGQGRGQRKFIKQIHCLQGLRSSSSGGHLDRDSIPIGGMECVAATVRGRGRKLSSQSVALKELNMQDEQMAHCEDRLHILCSHLNINTELILNKINADLLSLA